MENLMSDNQSSAAQLLTISSVPADNDKLSTGTLQIIARWKDSKEKTISPANRNRAVIIPESLWIDQLECNVKDEEKEVSSALRLHILDSFAELAKDYLSAITEESNWLRTQVPLSHFTITNLLNWQAEQAALSGRLNGDEIKSWIANSATVLAVTNSHGAEIGKALGEQFIKLASPNHGLTPEKAAKILANLWKSDDTDSNTGLRVQMRLTAISKKSAQTANVLDSIL